MKVCPKCSIPMVSVQHGDLTGYSCPNCNHAERVHTATNLLINNFQDYVANILYQYERPDAGVQWVHLREDLKKEFRQKAKQTVDAWVFEQDKYRSESDMLSRRGRLKLVKLKDESCSHNYIGGTCEKCGAVV